MCIKAWKLSTLTQFTKNAGYASLSQPASVSASVIVRMKSDEFQHLPPQPKLFVFSLLPVLYSHLLGLFCFLWFYFHQVLFLYHRLTIPYILFYNAKAYQKIMECAEENGWRVAKVKATIIWHGPHLWWYVRQNKMLSTWLIMNDNLNFLKFRRFFWFCRNMCPTTTM